MTYKPQLFVVRVGHKYIDFSKSRTHPVLVDTIEKARLYRAERHALTAANRWLKEESKPGDTLPSVHGVYIEIMSCVTS